MIGILTEKPSQARNFAKALGGNTGTYNGEQYVIACARGHLYELADPDKQVAPGLAAKYKSWNMEHLPWNETDFSWKKEMKEGVKKDLEAIKSAFAKCDELVYGGDVDPSGEGFMISYEIFNELKLRPKKWSRMYFMDEAPKSIQDAFTNRKAVPVPEQNDEYMMANYRGAWDFCSMQWTRIATKCGDGHSVLRQGRLKSAMVLLVGDALKALNAYKKIPFYQNRFHDENGIVYTNPNEPLFKTKDEVPQTYHSSPVVKDGVEMKSSAPPRLLDLATLSAKLAPKGAKANTVLSTYQKMYESQVVSYPRTEDKTITPEQFNELLPLADKIAAVVGVDPALLTHKSPRSTHVKPQGAHGANRPGKNVPKTLDELQQFGPFAKEIYVLLATSYLAMLAPDYEYEFQKGHVSEYPDFKGTASVPKKMGWKLVFNDSDDTDDDSSDKGLGTMADPFIHEGFPPKPPTPTMKWLMTQLEKRDIGTGATRTSTYADVTNEKTKYPLLKDTKGKITMTNFGDMSYALLPGTNIASLDVTERLQQEMKDVAAGKRSFAECLHDIQRMIKEDIITMAANGEIMRKEFGVRMAGENSADRYQGTWNGKNVSFKKEWSGHTFTDDECQRLCDGEEIEIEAVGKSGKPFKCKGRLQEQEYNGRKYVGFKNEGFINDGSAPAGGGSDVDKYEGTWNGRQVSFKRVWSGHTFTDGECRQLCDGNDIEVEAVGKSGKPFKCHGVLAEQEYNGRKYVGFKNLGFVNAGGQKDGVPDEWCGHKFTDAEKDSLNAGLSIEADDFLSKKSGKKFSAKVHYGRNDKGQMGIIPEF